MTRLTVRAGFGYSAVDPDIAWTDITQWVDIATVGVSISRGASDELSQTQTGTMTFTLDNKDGRFTPGRTTSPYWPYMRKRLPIDAKITTLAGVNFVTNPSFETDLADWEAGSVAPASMAVSTTHHRSTGAASMGIGWTNTATGGVVQTTIYGLTIGKVHTASLYVWVPSGGPAVHFTIDGVTSPANVVFDNWTRISAQFTASAASVTLQITTGTTSPVIGDLAWVDDVQVEEGAVATTWDGNAARVHDRFFGAVTSLPFGWKGLQSTVAVTVSDMFAWLSRQPTLRPMLVEEVLQDGPLVYYPLSEPDGSTSAGDLSGFTRPALATTQVGVGGTLQFGQGIGPPSDGLPTPLFTPVSSSVGKYLTTDLMTRLNNPENPGWYIYECWFATGTMGRVIMAWASNDPLAFEESICFLLDATTGHLTVEKYDGGTLATTTVGTPNLADNASHHLLYDELTQVVYVDGVSYALVLNPSSAMHVGRVGGYKDARLWQGTISHVAVYVNTGAGPAVASLTDHYTAGETAFSGENADVRIGRLAGYAGVSVTSVGAFSPVASQGELGSTALSHMRDVERTESGKLFCDRGSASLVIQGRSVRYNPVSSLTLTYADAETDGVGFADDDQKMVNIVVGSRPGGATQRVINQDSIDAYGPYQQELDILKTTDAEVLDAANWTVIRYADPPPEMRQLPVEGYSMPVATYRALLDAEISTVLTVTTLPDEAPSPTSTVSVEGYTETITQAKHLLDFHTSRADTDAVWSLDDPVYSVLGSTTRLAY